MRGNSQLNLPGFSLNKKKQFGGFTEGKGNPKRARPFDKKQAIHCVIKSSRAVGAHSFIFFERKILRLVSRQAKAFGVRVYNAANGGNHIHLLLKAHTRRQFLSFLRAVTGLLARMVLGAERGHASKVDKFFDARPFTRIVAFGRDFLGVKSYLFLNCLERIGLDRLSGRALIAEVNKQQSLSKLVPAGFG